MKKSREQLKAAFMVETEEMPLGSAIENTYVAHLGNPQAFGHQIWADARQRSWMEAKDSLAIGDGAAWIRNLVAEHFYISHQVVDWFHATQHLTEAARSLYNETTPQYRRWYRGWETKLFQGHARSLIRALKRQAVIKPDRSEAILQQTQYFQRNLKRMNYLEMRLEGYPIGNCFTPWWSASRYLFLNFAHQFCYTVEAYPKDKIYRSSCYIMK